MKQRSQIFHQHKCAEAVAKKKKQDEANKAIADAAAVEANAVAKKKKQDEDNKAMADAFVEVEAVAKKNKQDKTMKEWLMLMILLSMVISIISRYAKRLKQLSFKQTMC